MPSWTLPAAELRPVATTEQDRQFGPDLRFRGDYSVTAAGDYVVATGPEVIHQSIEREALAAPGELVRRPEWGMGVRAELLRPRTPTRVAELRTRVAARVRANPRVTRVRSVEVREVEFAAGKEGVEIEIRADGGGRETALPPIRIGGS